MNNLTNHLIMKILFYAPVKSRKALAQTSNLHYNIYNEVKKIKMSDLIYYWHFKNKYSKFPIIVSFNQKLVEIVPAIWILHSALNKNCDRQESRMLVAVNIKNNYYIDKDDNSQVFTRPNVILSKEFARLLYVYLPNYSLLNIISVLNRLLFKPVNFDLVIDKNVELPLLLANIYSKGNLLFLMKKMNTIMQTID